MAGRILRACVCISDRKNLRHRLAARMFLRLGFILDRNGYSCGGSNLNVTRT